MPSECQEKNEVGEVFLRERLEGLAGMRNQEVIVSLPGS